MKNMKLIKISKLKDGKYKIKLEDESIITYDDIILKYNLLYKKEIDGELYYKILDENNYYNLYNDCLKYCMKRVRCEKEVIDYLIKKEENRNIINKIIDKLKCINIINDKTYVTAYINDKIVLDNIGINKIRNDLIKNNIDKNLIDEELSKIDISIFDKKMKKIIENNVKNNKKYSFINLKNRIINNLVMKGYNKEDIITELDNYELNDYEILKREYNKLINKYDDKNKIINKLLSKSFKYNEILEIIKTEGE